MSGGNKAMELQMQIRQNAEDLHNFMKELDSWEEDIKKKDKQLRVGNLEDLQKTLPPVRNKDYKKKRKVRSQVPAENGQGEEKPVQRIKSSDYKSWDKFDVENALEALDKDISPAESNDSDSEEVQVDRDLAMNEKEKGNKFFKDGKYNDAIECYTKGMSADPYSPVLPTNRATCFFRLKKYAVAESDCNLAIALDSKYLKAYSRRGAARFALKNHQGALEDYEMVLKLDPENLDAQNEIKKLNQVLGSQKQDEGQTEKTVAEVPLIEAVKPKQLDTEQQKRQEAVVQKDLGNAYFKEGKYEVAVECYTKGMEADATNVLLAANRAMANLKLERYAEAEEDCTKAIALDNTYSKAFARRGTARLALGRLSEAKADFEQLLKLEPGNKQAMNELKKLNMEMMPTGLQQADDIPRRTVQPIDKPEHLRSTKPMRRIEIEEVGGKLTSIAEPQSLTAKASSSRSETLSSSSDRGRKCEASPCLSFPFAKIQKIEELSQPPSERPAKDPDGEFFGKQNVLHKKETVPGKTDQSLPASSVQVEVIPPPPIYSFQLEVDLRRLSNHPELAYQYLKQIQPDAFQTIFQDFLEPELLNKILKVLHRFYIKNEDPSVILAILKSLSSAGRFDIAVMLMSSAEKQVLQELFQCISHAGLEDDSVQALKKKYGV
ncbi:RNA polymerase II-associated protein 3 [Neoarius graeffei]|uniref:RNA polymerase II-associated protein 3 n=1 Tax=Neoarius graeffei TaxID=443677 RepID=UPI00298C2947|nr:RNA polymerase II-associated protein 3 [Neoarius graeffei]XP_060758876.1 RNA polymerase II-associated protein 3 [Neoarius graeffei]XP_060758877.1 RNA polymerase II-associated protein 3 [Neoarius graeffei]XP_060758878.1 RNA polymerase II-associated protein 3 [Neoarius graeffei]